MVLLFPARLRVLEFAGPEETKNQRGGNPPPDSDPFSDAESPAVPAFQQYAELRTKKKMGPGGVVGRMRSAHTALATSTP
jgi:hypothetical protein